MRSPRKETPTLLPLTHLMFGVLAIALPSATGGADAADRLITKDGVELRSDERVFVLFAALNGLGYSEESQRKGPPLRAPVYHPIRVQVRDALRKADEAGLTGGIRTMFDENPAEIEVYLEAILAGEGGNASPSAKKISAAIQVLETFRQKAELVKLFDNVALEQRTNAKELKTRLERDFAEAAKMLGTKELRAPGSLIVIPNPLDAYDEVRTVELKDRVLLVTGPGFPQAERAILQAALRPWLRRAVEASWNTPGGVKYAKSWDVLKSTPRVTKRFADGKSYLAETLARVLLFRARARVEGGQSKDREEELLEQLTDEGLRWARPVAHALDGLEAGEALETALPKLLAKSSP